MRTTIKKITAILYLALTALYTTFMFPTLDSGSVSLLSGKAMITIGNLAKAQRVFDNVIILDTHKYLGLLLIVTVVFSISFIFTIKVNKK